MANNVQIEIASDSAAPDEEITNNIQRRIQQAIERTQGLDSRQSVIAYVGVVESISNQSLNILVNNLTEFISVLADTAIRNEDQEEISLEELEIDGGVIAIGYYENELFQAIQLVGLDEVPQKSDKETVLARIVEITSRPRQIEVVVYPNQETRTISLTNSSELVEAYDPDNTLTLTELQPNDEVLLIYSETSEEYELIKLHRTTEASPSAQIEE